MSNPTDTANSAETPANPEVPPPGDEPLLEMRQVAGLTAGSVMGLKAGSFQFRESDKEVGFSLTVNSVDDVIVIPGSVTSMVDEIVTDQATPLGDAVLNVGSACFTVRSPRPEPSADARVRALLDLRSAPKAVPVPEFVEQSPELGQTRSSRFGSLFARTEDDEQPSLDQQSWKFLESIRDARSLVAERHRNLYPDPEELRSRLERLDPGLWDRAVEHPAFARFPIAYATIPWEPRFDDPDRIPVTLHQPIREMSCLPGVPVTANLLNGPLGIVGSRASALACARNAVLSLAALSAPTDIEFSIVTAQGLIDDWDWSSSLPNCLFPGEEQKYRIAVADGMDHFNGAGFDPDAVKDLVMGLIVLEDSRENLPDFCATVLEITPDGKCTVTNHLGEQVVATPIGMASAFATATANLIRVALEGQPFEEHAKTVEIEPVPQPEHRSGLPEHQTGLPEHRMQSPTVTGDLEAREQAKKIIDDLLAEDEIDEQPDRIDEIDEPA